MHRISCDQWQRIGAPKRASFLVHHHPRAKSDAPVDEQRLQSCVDQGISQHREPTTSIKIPFDTLHFSRLERSLRPSDYYARCICRNGLAVEKPCRLGGIAFLLKGSTKLEIAFLAAVGELVLTVLFQKIDRLPTLTQGAEEGSRNLGFCNGGATSLSGGCRGDYKRSEERRVGEERRYRGSPD